MALRHLGEVDIPWESGDRVLDGQAETDWLWNRSVQYAEEVETMALGIYFPHVGFTAEKYREVIKQLDDAGAGAPTTLPSNQTVPFRSSISGTRRRSSMPSERSLCPFSRPPVSSSGTPWWQLWST
jgi:hypothetical protein